MKKILVTILTTVMLAFSCIFFFNAPSVASALISNRSGNKFVFTGLLVNGEQHYFVNENGESTLENASLEDNGGEYYSLELKGDHASGWGEFAPTPDINAMIQKGLVYVKATATVQSNKPSNVTFTVTYGDQTTSATNLVAESNVETPLMHLTEFAQNIRFSFEASNCDSTIFEPTLHLYTQIDSVELKNENSQVSPGQYVRVNAFNDITTIEGVSGNFLAFSRINHAIKYEFVSGEEYVELISPNFIIKNNAPIGAEITFRAVCKKTSFNDEPIYSKYVTFTVTDQVVVDVRTDFEDPATIIGEDVYEPGDRVRLSVIPHEGYQFVGWYIETESHPIEWYYDEEQQQHKEPYSTRTTITIDAILNQDVYARFIKDITVSGLTVLERPYDGTDIIDPVDVTVNFNGRENNHDITLDGVEYSYGGVDAGDNKAIDTDAKNAILVGSAKSIYRLTSKRIPTSFGRITKREAYLTVDPASKSYGDLDPEFHFVASNLVMGETIEGALGREAGEEVGQYAITSGELPKRYTNYNIVLLGDPVLNILPRELTLEYVRVDDKVYDGTTDATLRAVLGNIRNNDVITVKLSGQFESADVGDKVEVKITKATLEGEKKHNYCLASYNEKIYGKITPREISVTAKDAHFVYGDEISLDYKADGLIEGDVLEGELAIDSKSAGEHEIQIGTLSNLNKNYEISFTSALCTIDPKAIKVIADKGQNKFYGDQIEDLTYTAPGLVGNDELEGKLSRVPGENVGHYDILIGSLKNPNYVLQFESALFEIKRRPITAEITFKDRYYDGTTDIEVSVEWKNNILNENFVLLIDATLSGKDTGEQNVTVHSTQVEGDSLRNYTFECVVKNNSINILKRPAGLYISNYTKTYGEKDEAFNYTLTNLVPNETVLLNITRKEGEVVGQYPFSVETIGESNYDINILTENFVINPKMLEVVLENNEKFFGDEDPEMTFHLADASQLCFSDVEKDVLNGKVSRRAGETAGMYEIDFSNISTNPNYSFTAHGGIGFKINLRPVNVTLKNATKKYGDNDPKSYDYDIENLVEGEDLSLTITRQPGEEDVGTYPLICATKSDPRLRYEIRLVNQAVLTIEPCQISLKAEDKVKFYGEEDPALSVTIIDGMLKFNDRLSVLQQNELSRDDGENVGTYAIKQGNFGLGPNYEIVSFENGTLSIKPREITISAIAARKAYGDSDPDFQVEVTEGRLYFKDKIIGQPERDAGENVGPHTIKQGSVKIDNDNYQINFVKSQLEIYPRPIEVIPINISKVYGEVDEPIRYEIKGGLIADDKLEGRVYRDISMPDHEHTGRYQIYCTLSNDNYDITFGNHYYVIEQRIINIKAQNITINYGEEMPELEYEISGTIQEGDHLEGGLYCAGGINAGDYEIRSTFNLGSNYKIEFEKGVLTVLPLKLKISTDDYQKVYGQFDPNFTYKIIEGQLINDDQLFGFVTREENENVGIYPLVCGLYNMNYQIEFDGGNLEIKPKEAKLVTSVYDKVYDGTKMAMLRNPYLMGLIDKEVYLEYNDLECARFESAEVGNHIKIILNDISLRGDKAQNYNLVLPDDLYGNITYRSISDGNFELSTEEAVLYANYSLCAEFIENENIQIGDHKSLGELSVTVDGQDNLQVRKGFTITLKISGALEQNRNFYVYTKDDNGNFILASSRREGDRLIIHSDELGTFYIVTDDEQWMWYAWIGSIGALGLVIIAFAAILITKACKKHNKKSS